MHVPVHVEDFSRTSTQRITASTVHHRVYDSFSHWCSKGGKIGLCKPPPSCEMPTISGLPLSILNHEATGTVNLSCVVSHDTVSKFSPEDAEYGVLPITAERLDAPIKRILRSETKSTHSWPTTKSAFRGEERDITATTIVKMTASAMKAKAKLNIMLMRGFSPNKAMGKLSVTSLNSKNFNNFARYYARYLIKYPEKRGSIPATPEDAIVLPKLAEWLREKLRPSQVREHLKELGSTRNLERYVQQYTKEADNAIVSPKLTEWLQQKRPPSQVNMLLKELEVVDVSKFMGQYMEAGAATTAFNKWLGKRLFPQQVAKKLVDAEVPNVNSYLKEYVSLWGKRQAGLSRLRTN
ncbi:unnamed protein product [Phytophthora fragariaefolia]|uniref:Unnamed protein product n=1 Tax=Phytophthora fragariaefolia TaxID=1490495 RepID=A0A9W6Y9Q0_9STRA|nr:unnamed protein product [Phytophthora fragariaefolia]